MNNFIREPAVSDDDALVELFKDSGVDYDAIEQEVQNEEMAGATTKVVNQVKDIVEGTDKAPPQGLAERLGKGAAIGMQDLVRNIWNGLVTLGNHLEDWAASKGVGKGDIITEANKIEDPYKGKDLGTAEEVGRRTAQFLAPLAGGWLAAGPRAALTAEAVYSFFAMDPESQRFSDLLKGTFVEEIPLVADVVDHLQTKPDDTEIEARLKNLAEGVGFSGAIMGSLWSGSKVYSKLKTAKTNRVLETAVERKEEAKIGAVVARTDDAPAPKPMDEGTPAIADDAVTTTKAPADDLPLFEKEWATLSWDKPGVNVVKDAATKASRIEVNLTDDNLVEAFNAVARDTDNIPKLRGPITDEEAMAAAEHLRKNPDFLERMASWTPDQGAVAVEDMLALNYIAHLAEDSLSKSLSLAMNAAPDSPELIKFMRDFDNFTRILGIQNGNLSEAGRTLRISQVLANLADTDQKKAVELLGNMGRRKMYNELIKKYGGPENIKKNATNLAFMKEWNRISKIPDTDFMLKMDEVVELTKFDKLEDAITRVALNSMLSRPTTWFRAALGNFFMTSKQAVDNYISVGIGNAREVLGGQKNAMALAEANAHLKAHLWAYIEGLAPAVEAFRRKRGGIPTKMELSGPRNVPHLDDVGVRSTYDWVLDKGVQVLTLGELPRRMLVSLDTYFNHINFKGHQNAALVRAQASGKVKSLEEVENYLRNMHKVDPAEYANARTNAMTATFSNPQVEGTLGHTIMRATERSFDKFGIPFQRVVVPFLNTSINITRETVAMTPFALLYKNSGLYKGIQQGGRAADMAIAKFGSGTVGVIGTMLLLDQDDLIIGRPASDAQKDLAKAFPSGKDIPPGPAIRAADGKYYSLRGLEPFSSIISTAATLKTMSGLVSEEEYLDAARAFGALTLDIISPETYTEFFSNMIAIAEGTRDPSKTIAEMATRFVPYQGALSTATRYQDKIRRDITPSPTDDTPMGKLQELQEMIKNRIQANNPWGSGDLPAMRNYFGRAVRIPDGLGPDEISPIASSDGRSLELKKALESIVDFNDNYANSNANIPSFGITMPARVLPNPAGVGISYHMTPLEYSDFLVIRNGLDPFTGELLPGVTETLEDRYYTILGNYGVFTMKPSEIYHSDPMQYTRMISELQEATTAYTEAARGYFIGEYNEGAIREKMKKQLEDWAEFEPPTKGAVTLPGVGRVRQ